MNGGAEDVCYNIATYTVMAIIVLIVLKSMVKDM